MKINHLESVHLYNNGKENIDTKMAFYIEITKISYTYQEQEILV